MPRPNSKEKPSKDKGSVPKKPKTLLQYVEALLSQQSKCLGLLQIKKGLLDSFDVNCMDGAAKSRLITALKQGVAQGLLGKVGPQYFVVGSNAEANAKQKAASAVLTQHSLDLLDAVREPSLRKCVKALAAGANVNFKDPRVGCYKHTPLIAAAFKGGCDSTDMEAIFKLLLEEKADVNARDSLGQTAMMHCTIDSALVKILLENGANVSIRGNNCTALQIAEAGRYEDTIQLLKDYGATFKDSHPEQTRLSTSRSGNV